MEPINRKEWVAMGLALAIFLGVLGFRLFAPPGSGSPADLEQSYTLDYAGLQLEKSVKISAAGHEEKLLAKGSDVVFLSVIPTALEDDLAEAMLSSSGDVEVLPEYNIAVAHAKEGKPLSMVMRFAGNRKNLSTISLALPKSFYNSLSEEQLSALYAELKGFNLLESPVDSTREVERQLAVQVSEALAT